MNIFFRHFFPVTQCKNHKEYNQNKKEIAVVVVVVVFQMYENYISSFASGKCSSSRRAHLLWITIYWIHTFEAKHQCARQGNTTNGESNETAKKKIYIKNKCKNTNALWIYIQPGI